MPMLNIITKNFQKVAINFAYSSLYFICLIDFQMIVKVFFLFSWQ